MAETKWEKQKKYDYLDILIEVKPENNKSKDLKWFMADEIKILPTFLKM